MQLSQVLNEEQRRERFASSLQRKRALNEGNDEESDEDPTAGEAQDLSLPLPEETEDLVVPSSTEPSVMVSTCVENLRLFTSTASVPRHLCTPPPLMPNHSSGFQFTMPPSLPVPAFNIQSALIQQLQEQYNRARWQSQNPVSTPPNLALTPNTSNLNASIQRGLDLNQSGSVVFRSGIGKRLQPQPAASLQSDEIRPVNSYRPRLNLDSLKFPANSSLLRSPPPLMENPRPDLPSTSSSLKRVPETYPSKVQANEVYPRISVIRNSKRSKLDHIHSETSCDDLMEIDNTVATTTSTTTATLQASPNKTSPNRADLDYSSPEPWEPKVSINYECKHDNDIQQVILKETMVEIPMIEKYVHKKFSKFQFTNYLNFFFSPLIGLLLL